MPVIGGGVVRWLLPVFDKIVGDGEGLGDHAVNILFAVDVLMALSLLAIIFLMILKVDYATFMVNLCFIIVILYGFEYYLYKTDPFLKLPFDSGYYDANLLKYKNFLKPGFDPYTPYRTWGNITRSNRFGFREREVGEKHDSIYRIMVLGDSFTWGAGLSEQQRYSNLLDSLLKNAGFNAEVLNFGYSGSPTTEERDLLAKIGGVIKPDLIIVGFCINDPQPLSEDYSVEKERFNQRFEKLINAFQKRMSFIRLQYAGDLIKQFIYKLAGKAGVFPSDTEALGRVYDKQSHEWREFEKALTDIKRISDSLGCDRPIMGIFNQMSSIDSEKVLRRMKQDKRESIQIRLQWLAQVRETAEKKGFIAIDYGPFIVEEIEAGRLSPDSLTVTPLDGHPSFQLNKIYAQKMYEIIAPTLRAKSD